ncbi:MAG: GntR family transcriptional regulator [Clostridiales bacterium]|nr:GntR family transcriptional regulator [Clostridiales bacterium]
MNIYISNTSGLPIYQQITDQIKEKIINGDLSEGELLPSIRYLAKELRISVITTKRAYEDLERDGFIYTLQGKGSFVAKQNPQLRREEALKKTEGYLNQAIESARAGCITKEEIREMLELLLEGF